MPQTEMQTQAGAGRSASCFWVRGWHTKTRWRRQRKYCTCATMGLDWRAIGCFAKDPIGPRVRYYTKAVPHLFCLLCTTICKRVFTCTSDAETAPGHLAGMNANHVKRALPDRSAQSHGRKFVAEYFAVRPYSRKSPTRSTSAQVRDELHCSTSTRAQVAKS